MSKEKTWSRFLNEVFGCVAEEETGNRPCDYGLWCDRCHSPKVEAQYQQWKNEE